MQGRSTLPAATLILALLVSPLVPRMSARAAGGVPSDACTKGTLVQGYVEDEYARLAVQDGGSGQTWLCYRLETSAHSGGGRFIFQSPVRVTVVPPALDDKGTACNDGLPIVEIGDPSQPEAYLHIHLTQSTSTNATWLCVDFRYGTQPHRHRLIITTPTATTAPPFQTFPDPAGSYANPPAVPAPRPSAACQLSGGTRYVNLFAGGSHLWLYSHTQGSVTRLCVRVDGSPGAGGRLTIDSRASASATPVIEQTTDGTRCTLQLLKVGDVVVRRSDVTNPASLCVTQDNGATWSVLTAGFVASYVLPSAVWTFD